jgi:3-phenylpropionate/trans-cinnamate dioxygenase ferredoxin reductase component
MSEAFVIVGAGLAGGGAAATLREEGFDGRVVLIGAEPQPPYERPPLSKEYLRGESPFEQALLQSLDFYAESDIEARIGVRVTRVDATEKEIELDNGESVPYEALLVATGGRNRRIPIPGIDLQGVYGLRTVADSDHIRAEISPGRKAVVVGMGFIGSEVAASLRQSGVEVAVVDRNTVPLRRVLGEEVGRVVEGIHRDHGTELILEDRVAAFEGAERGADHNPKRSEHRVRLCRGGPGRRARHGTTRRHQCKDRQRRLGRRVLPYGCGGDLRGG